MDDSKLFELALEQIKPADWGLFEKLCSHFFAVEFPQLRTMANPSGDKGRDSELFSPDGEPQVCLQYSLSLDWATKIKNTLTRLKENFSHVNFLIYASSHEIGAKGDDIKKHLLSEGCYLDIRDRNWFLERQESNNTRITAADELIDRIATPYLKGFEERKSKISPLTNNEARTALTYLALQFHDDDHNKGLTKVCFDALIRSALRNSSIDKPVTKEEIVENIIKVLALADRKTLVPFIDSSLIRLKNNVIGHNKEKDCYFLKDDECTRIRNRLSETAVEEEHFQRFLSRLCIEFLSESPRGVDKNDVEDLLIRIPRIIELLCISNGEQFVTALRNNQVDIIKDEQINDIVYKDINANPYRSAAVSSYPRLIQHVIRAVATSEDPATCSYINNLSTSYTLLAFLNQTPDVQKATKRIFSHGKIWLDTSVVLPLFAEQLKEDEHSRTYQSIYSACRAEGDKLFITKGVLNEIDHHMQNTLKCSKKWNRWSGNYPFLFDQYFKSGRSIAEYEEWIETFRSDIDPISDIESYLKEEFEISVKPLIAESQLVDNEELTKAVEQEWNQAHGSRRSQNDVTDTTIDTLARNDIEMYLGVIGLRQEERVDKNGPRIWLLTKDTTAWNLKNKIKARFDGDNSQSPLLSTSFLLNSIAFSPRRSVLSKNFELGLPTILDIEFEESQYRNFVELAEEIRIKNADLPERTLQRKIRQEITKARWKKWHEVQRSDTPNQE